jgi:hypothetical protein
VSFRCEAFYLIEPRPELANHLLGQVDPDFAEVLLEPRLYRRQEGGNSAWLHADRLAQAKLVFLASLREYDLVVDDAGFAAVFGSAVVSVELFDRWFTVRRLEVEQELELLEARLREPGLRVEPSGRPLVDLWLSAACPQHAEPDVARDRPRD